MWRAANMLCLFDVGRIRQDVVPLPSCRLPKCHPVDMMHDAIPKATLTAAHVRDFHKLVQETTGASLSDQDAWERATELVSLFRMFVGPLPEDAEGDAVQTSSSLTI
jgi:hypothetical protein